MVQILEEVPSFGAQFARSFGKGLTGGLEKGLTIAQQLAGKREKLENQQRAKREALAGAASRDFAAFTKQYHPTLFENKDLLNKANGIYQDIIASNPNFSEKDKQKAFALAVEGAQESSGKASEESGGGFFNLPKPKRSLLEILSASKEGQPESLLQRLTKMGSGEKLSTGQFFGGLALGAIEPWEDAFSFGTPFQKKKTLSGQAKEALSKDLSPGQQEQFEQAQLVGGLTPWDGLAKKLTTLPGVKGFWNSAKSLGKKEGIATNKAAENILKQAADEGIDLAKVAKGDAQEVERLNSISARISKGAPKAAEATEKRVARVEPKEKLFKTTQEQANRERQVKEVGKYQAEIEKDTADRIARREKLVPKTEAGKLSLQGRISVAEKNLPKAREEYYKAGARLRALEDLSVKAPQAEKAVYEDILKSAQKDLKDAEFNLNTTLSNAKTGSSKVGLEEMRAAARQKMTDISDKISEGAEVTLHKRDYNPQMIKEAKAISKKKPLPGQDRSDYFTQVHGEYANEYENQIGRIEQEMKTLPKNMSGLQRLRELEKERDVLRKLVDHIDAENIIHRRKLALRGMSERQKAEQRLKKFEVRKDGGKVSEIAREKIQEQAKTAVKNPTGPEAEALAYKAGVKKENVGDAIKAVEDGFKDIKAKAATTPLKKLLKEGEIFFNMWKKEGWYKAFTKTPVGEEILFTLTDIAASEALGSKGLALGGFRQRRMGLAIIRKGIVYAWHKGKHEFQTHQYVEAVKKGNEKKRSEIAAKHPKAATEGRKRLKGS
jgi:hypothetical protein